MPAGDDLCKVQARNLTPDFYDYYDSRDTGFGTYNPAAVKEWGFMWRTEAETARDLGNVYIHVEHTPLFLERN